MQADLAPTEAYLLDGGGSELWLWAGGRSSAAARDALREVAALYAEALGTAAADRCHLRGFAPRDGASVKPAPTVLVDVVPGQEPLAFVGCFCGWSREEAAAGVAANGAVSHYHRTAAGGGEKEAATEAEGRRARGGASPILSLGDLQVEAATIRLM